VCNTQIVEIDRGGCLGPWLVRETSSGDSYLKRERGRERERERERVCVYKRERQERMSGAMAGERNII
jgi:hypothetical protein